MRARAHIHVFWGSCWTALKVPLFSLHFFVEPARSKRGGYKKEERKRQRERSLASPGTQDASEQTKTPVTDFKA